MAQFQFVMRSGPTPGVTYPLEGDQLTIGRDSVNGVAINDAEVSRKHSRLTFQGGKYVIEDLGSTNGTFVNGQRLAGPVVLKAGDVVSLGEQIVLMYDSMNMDAGATVAQRRSSYPPPPPVQQAPAPVYSSMPASSAPAKKSNTTPMIIGGVALLLICSCIAFLVYVDSNFLWCTFFPFLGGC